MGKKLSLLLAAALFAVTFQTAMAADGNEMDDEIDEQIESVENPGPRDGRFGRRMGIGGRWGHGPAMPGKFGPGGPEMHDGFGPRGRHHFGPGGMGMGMGMMHRLDLSADQKRQMVDVMTENFRERLLARIELEEAFKKLRDLHESDNSDHDAIIEANQAVGAAHGKLDVLDRKMKDSVKSVLTPDQQKKLEEFRARRDDFRRDRNRDRGGKPRPPRMQTGPGPRVME